MHPLCLSLCVYISVHIGTSSILCACVCSVHGLTAEPEREVECCLFVWLLGLDDSG